MSAEASRGTNFSKQAAALGAAALGSLVFGLTAGIPVAAQTTNPAATAELVSEGVVIEVDGQAARSNPPVPVPAQPRPTFRTATTVAEIVTAQNYIQSLDAPVLRFYQAYFNRSPDTDGAKYWLDIRRLGFSQPEIASFMAESEEFQNTYAGTTNRQYVTGVYSNVLGRSFDPDGFDYWLGLLDSGELDRAGVVQWITANGEFIDAHPFIPAGVVPGPTLTVSEPDPGRPSYDRDSFNTWNDADGDCQNARHEVLIRDSLDSVEFSASGCSVVEGRWVDPYTGTVFTKASDVSIDHFIPLSEAHRSGAWRWSDAQKESFGNDITDPAALRVTGTNSNQSKGDSSPDKWLPRLEFQCDYVVDWASQKARWGLSVTTPEANLIAAMATRCSFAMPAFIQGGIPVTPVAPPPGDPDDSGDSELRILSCLRRAELVTVTNPGSSPVSLAGWELHDEGRKHFEEDLSVLRASIPAGGQLTFASGDNPASGPTTVIFKEANIWNNTGDTATLVSPTGATTSLRCTN